MHGHETMSPSHKARVVNAEPSGRYPEQREAVRSRRRGRASRHASSRHANDASDSSTREAVPTLFGNRQRLVNRSGCLCWEPVCQEIGEIQYIS